MPTRSISIKLDKVRRLCYNFNAFAELEEQFDISIVDLTKILAGPVKLKVLRAILWAGLLEETPEITIQEVGRIIDESDWVNRAVEISEAISEAFLRSTFSKAEDEKKATGPKPESGKEESTS